jgi:hypothetical protein
VASGTGGEGFGYFQAWTDSEARIVARQTIQQEPDINSSKTAYIPLGAPFPAFGLSGVMIAISARGYSGSPTMNFVTRTFTGDPSLPLAWNTGTPLLGTDKTFSNSDGFEDYNTGNLAFAPADVAFAQIGVKSPAAADGIGTFDIIVAAKY